LYAVAPGAVAAGDTVLLEPMTTVFALVGMLCLLRRPPAARAAAAGGACLAAALAVKLFAGVYVLVAAGWLLQTARERLLPAAAFLRSSSYFDHYAAFFTAPLAITLGVALAAGSIGGLLVRGAAASTVAGLLAAGCLASVRADSEWQSGVSLTTAVARVVPT